MSRDNLENQSLYGMIVEKDGQAVMEVRHRDGKVEHIPIHNPDQQPVKRHRTDPFEVANTKTIPSPWDPNVDTEILVPKTDKHPLLRLPAKEHVRRSCQLEALMHKYFCDPKSETTSVLDTRGNELAKAIIADLQRICGGEWLDKRLK